MKGEFDGKTLTVCLEGRIDSGNSSSWENAINAKIEERAPEQVVLDAEKLEYISSAGLRIVLKLRKRFADLKIVNVSVSVYEILEMTGFTELVTVEKAYRQFDVSGCEVIGKGANGTVYRIARDTIVKVYHDAESLDDIKRERELSRTAFLLGIPTAIPYDVVKVGNTYGSVFELLNAKSFDELLREDEQNMEFIAKETVEIAKIIHSTKAPANLPRQRDVALDWVGMVTDYFTPEQHEKLRCLIEAIPEDGFMLHGDMHIKNIMLQNKETLLIDMDTLCTGHPIYELAFMYNAYKGFGIVDPADVSNFMGIPADTAYRLWRLILTMYLGTDDKARLDEVEEKAALIGILRVMRRVIRFNRQNTPDGKAIVDACHDFIAEKLDRIDTLTF